jgi:hypothetical protein
MKGATDYEDQGDLKNPVNQVVAVLPREAEVERIVAAYIISGFASDDIGVLSGRKDAHKLDAASGKQGWFTKLVATLGNKPAKSPTCLRSMTRSLSIRTACSVSRAWDYPVPNRPRARKRRYFLLTR